ncbi:hypothetical protein [Klebsiella phage 37P2]|nr:hypothetical protein [Klebsiella phage 37P2]
MIIRLFKFIGLVFAWAFHCLAISPIVLLALIIMLIQPLISEERLDTVGEWGWPDKYEGFITKITGVKV